MAEATKLQNPTPDPNPTRNTEIQNPPHPPTPDPLTISQHAGYVASYESVTAERFRENGQCAQCICNSYSQQNNAPAETTHVHISNSPCTKICTWARSKSRVKTEMTYPKACAHHKATEMTLQNNSRITPHQNGRSLTTTMNKGGSTGHVESLIEVQMH